MQSVSRIWMAVVAMALLIGTLALPASASGQADAERLLAAGAGQAFAPARGGTTFAATECFTDPSGDVRDLEANEVPRTEPRADIVDLCADYTGENLTLSVAVDTPTDPATDVNWNGALLGWFIDVNGDNDGEFFASLKIEDDAPVARVFDRSGDPAEEICPAAYAFDGTTITLTIQSACLARPDSVSVSPGLVYDQRVENATGHAVFDAAPNDGTLEGPVAATRLGASFEPGTQRIAGADRIETAILASQASFADGVADTVVLTRADNFPDAQVGTPLALRRDAPLLLTNSDILDPRVVVEMDRVTGTDRTVIIVGGTAAVSTVVEAEIAALGYTVERYSGSNRFATGVAVAIEGLDTPDTVLVTNGGDFADSVIAGAASGEAVDGPEVAAVLLTSGADMSPETQAYLDANTPGTTITIGDQASEALPDADQSIVGPTLFDTAIMVAEAFFPNPTVVGFATGLDFADALSGGSVMGNPVNGPGPLLLTDPAILPSTVETYLTDTESIVSAVIFGGTSAIQPQVEDQIQAAITR